MENKNIDQKELQNIINNNFKFCWLCGRRDILSNHHVIPQRYQGAIVNITIPMCKNCQLIMHKEEEFVSLLRRLLW